LGLFLYRPWHAKVVNRPEGMATQGMTAAIKHGHIIVREFFCPLTLCFEQKKQNVFQQL